MAGLQIARSACSRVQSASSPLVLGALLWSLLGYGVFGYAAYLLVDRLLKGRALRIQLEKHLKSQVKYRSDPGST